MNGRLLIQNDDKGLWFPISQQNDTTPNQSIIVFEIVKKTLNAMKKAIIALRKNLDYNAHYNAFLLDQINKEEFEKISNEFAISFNEFCPDDIKSEIELLLMATGEKFVPSEIADIFHIEESEAEKVLANLES